MAAFRFVVLAFGLLCTCGTLGATIRGALTPQVIQPDDSRQNILTTLNKDVSLQVGTELDFVADVIARFNKNIEFQGEIEAKLLELLAKASLCRENSAPAVEALEKKLSPLLESADRSEDVDPMMKFVSRAQTFTTANYAFPDSGMGPKRVKLAKLVKGVLGRPVTVERGLTEKELWAWHEQSSVYGRFMAAGLNKEEAIAINASALIHQSFLKSQYHIWHVLPDFVPAMRNRAKYLPSYAPLHKAVLVLAEHCRKEEISLNQTLQMVRERRAMLRVRQQAFIDMYARGGGLINGTAVDTVLATHTSTRDLLNTAQTLFGTNPKVGTTSLGRAEAMLRYWLTQLSLRDPRSAHNTMQHMNVKRGPAAVDENIPLGAAAAYEAELELYGNMSVAAAQLVKLTTDYTALNRARKWVSYWRGVVAWIKSQNQKQEEVKKKEEVVPPGQIAQPVIVSSRYMQFLADWEAKLAVAPPGSRSYVIANDWVNFWRNKLGITKK